MQGKSLATNSLDFSLSEKVFISLSLLKYNLEGTEF
jgi:hypothetical protein